MIEVFKTNVEQPEQAEMLLVQLRKHFADCIATFDLEDCDKILRVECKTGTIPSATIINLLHDFGVFAETLPDNDEPIDQAMLVNMKGLSAK